MQNLWLLVPLDDKTHTVFLQQCDQCGLEVWDQQCHHDHYIVRCLAHQGLKDFPRSISQTASNYHSRTILLARVLPVLYGCHTWDEFQQEEELPMC